MSIDGTLLHDGGVAADVPLPQALELRPTRVFVLPTLADETPRPTAWLLLDRVFGRPGRGDGGAASPGVEVQWLRAPAFTGNPYSFRDSRRLIDEAHALTEAHLDRLEWVEDEATPSVETA